MTNVIVLRKIEKAPHNNCLMFIQNMCHNVVIESLYCLNLVLILSVNFDGVKYMWVYLRQIVSFI